MIATILYFFDRKKFFKLFLKSVLAACLNCFKLSYIFSVEDSFMGWDMHIGKILETSDIILKQMENFFRWKQMIWFWNKWKIFSFDNKWYNFETNDIILKQMIRFGTNNIILKQMENFQAGKFFLFFETDESFGNK